jgi:hypothetical protein
VRLRAHIHREETHADQRNADTNVMGTLSPELALVDEELANAARLNPSLESSFDLLDSSSRVGERPARAGLPASRPLPPRPRRRAERRELTIILVAAALICVLAFMRSDQSSPRSSSGDVAPRSKDSRTTTRGTTSHATPVARPRTRVLQWPSVADADLYNVVFLDGDQRVDVWPRTNRIAVRGLRGATGHALGPGTYAWFVYAGFRELGRVRYGPLVAHGRLVVRN